MLIRAADGQAVVQAACVQVYEEYSGARGRRVWRLYAQPRGYDCTILVGECDTERLAKHMLEEIYRLAKDGLAIDLERHSTYLPGQEPAPEAVPV